MQYPQTKSVGPRAGNGSGYGYSTGGRLFILYSMTEDIRVLEGNVPREVTGVKTITFNAFDVSNDGEALLFYVRDRRGTKTTLAVHWLQLAPALQIMARAAKAGAKKERRWGRSTILMFPRLARW
jgi:hypothetical protein